MDALVLARVRTVCGCASALAIGYKYPDSAYSVLVLSTAGSGDGLGDGCDCRLGRLDVRLVGRRCPSPHGLDQPFWYARCCGARCCSASEAVAHVSLRIRHSVALDGSLYRGDEVLLFQCCPALPGEQQACGRPGEIYEV